MTAEGDVPLPPPSQFLKAPRVTVVGLAQPDQVCFIPHQKQTPQHQGIISCPTSFSSISSQKFCHEAQSTLPLQVWLK